MISSKVDIPLSRHELLKWDGWGYEDSKFELNDEGNIQFIGGRYMSGDCIMVSLKSWLENNLGLCFTDKYIKRENLPHVPTNIVNIQKDVLEEMKKLNIKSSEDYMDRLFRSHGHTLEEIYRLKVLGSIKRIPDIVLWPENHGQVEDVIKFASAFDMVIIPYGGGTSVTKALMCPVLEERYIISLDTSQMKSILWLKDGNLTACIQAGINGQELNYQLSQRGYCLGHEPDSFEFSTLGGWVATRASGMKKNLYGNIEDLVIHIKVATPKGTISKKCMVPRSSTGPDVQQFILGSEGILGVITEVVVKIRPIPQFTKYDSVVFPNFVTGLSCVREIARERCAPASVRLVDNTQFVLGQALKPMGSGSYMDTAVQIMKKLYITKVKRFDPGEMCAATLLFEGTNKEDLDYQERRLQQIIFKHGGVYGGEDNGYRGYLLTFLIAYLRDLGLEYGVVSESFETSVPWDKVFDLCANVKARIAIEAKSYGIQNPIFVSCRVTQTYDAGACVYFYLAFKYEALVQNPVEIYEKIEKSARDEILKNGGSLSHHHGVGKIRKDWLENEISTTAISALKAIKKELDPKNIFANGNLFDI